MTHSREKLKKFKNIRLLFVFSHVPHFLYFAPTAVQLEGF